MIYDNSKTLWEKNMNTQIKAGFFLSQKVDTVGFIDYLINALLLVEA